MTVSFKDLAKCILVANYSIRHKKDSHNLMGKPLSFQNCYFKALAWLTKKKLMRDIAGSSIITAKGRRYVEKKRLLHNPRYAPLTTGDE